jgi:hypothetical protein
MKDVFDANNGNIGVKRNYTAEKGALRVLIEH